MHGARAWSDKRQPCVFHRGDHGFVFRHKTVARKDSVVAIIFGNLNDLLNAYLTLCLVHAGVVWHTVNA